MNEFKQIFDKVRKPGRYIGEETNIVHKNFSAGRTSVVLAYPDIYEVGMSYLGLRLLYHLLNERDDIVCERVFMPWDDMARELTDRGQKLFSLESRTDINRFDILGFSLSYELTYTNVLSMLHLGGVTLTSNKRRDNEPIVIAGGACCYNPEPMSEFIDAFLIGDGEEALVRFINEYRRSGGRKEGRRKLMKRLALLENVYVPSLYRSKYSGKKFQGLEPIEEKIPETTEKAVMLDFENAYYPVKQIVPLIKTVHDRIAVEIMRGCPNKCRFCQATAVNHPLRIRTPERVRDICRESYEHTGYERIALLSFSSVDYPYLAELIKTLTEDFREKGVGISMPSLRIDKAFYALPEMISIIRKAGLTFAPESASDLTRKSLGKGIDIKVLCESARRAFLYGWQRLKLYFMAGFPSEDENEAENIINLAREISSLRKKVSKNAAEVKVSVNPFVPKPHTPFQWCGMKSKDELSVVRNKLLSGGSRRIRIEFHNLEQSLLEACLSRGDRSMAGIIYTAWKRGAKMDGWRDFFDFRIWEESFRENGEAISSYACRRYEIDDILPWAHIRTGIDETYLKAEFRKSGFCEH